MHQEFKFFICRECRGSKSGGLGRGEDWLGDDGVSECKEEVMEGKT